MRNIVVKSVSTGCVLRGYTNVKKAYKEYTEVNTRENHKVKSYSWFAKRMADGELVKVIRTIDDQSWGYYQWEMIPLC